MKSKSIRSKSKSKKGKKKNWIKHALSGHKGTLRATATRKGLLHGKDDKLSKSDLHKLEKMGGKTAKRAYMAETLSKFKKGGNVNIIKEDDFYEKYKPQINHIERKKQPKSVADEDVTSFGGTMYETYGEEEQYVRKMAQDPKTAKRVWTIVTDDDGDLLIVAGFHFVNRMGYIITEKEWNTGAEYVEEEYEKGGSMYYENGSKIEDEVEVEVGRYYMSLDTGKTFRVVYKIKNENVAGIVDENQNHSKVPLDKLNNDLIKSKIEKIYAKGGSMYAKGGQFRVGSLVKIDPDNDNENYDSFRDKPLKITHKATSSKDHPGYDEGMEGMPLYDFEDVPFSLYEYEIVKYEGGGSMYAKGGKVKEISFENSNLYLYGFDKDNNGNSVIKVGFPNQRAFYIQINDPAFKHSYNKKSYPLNELTPEDIGIIEKEVVDYVSEYGSDAQKSKLKVYGNVFNAGGSLYSGKSYELNKDEYNYLLPVLRKKLLQRDDKYYFIADNIDDLTDMLNRLKGLYNNYDELKNMVAYKCATERSLKPFRDSMANGGSPMEVGGSVDRPKSAIARDRKYVSEEEWEKNYKRKKAPKKKHYRKLKNSSIFK